MMNSHGIVDSAPPGPVTSPQQIVPAATTDTHFHIFGPLERYPLSSKRLYNPCLSDVSAYRDMARTVGITRMVIVQASIYGTDNSCLLDSIAEFGQQCARGVAVVDENVTPLQLREMHEKGVRGIRFNAITGVTRLDWLEKIAEMIAPLGWHIQLWIKADRLLEIAPAIRRLPVDVVLDHMAQIPLERGLNDPQVKNVLQLMQSERCWMKLIGYRVSNLAYPHADLDTFAKQIINIAPERCLWGSDWPHIYLEGRPMPDAGKLLDSLYRWCAPELAKQILVDNPTKRYGFESTTSR